MNEMPASKNSPIDEVVYGHRYGVGQWEFERASEEVECEERYRIGIGGRGGRRNEGNAGIFRYDSIHDDASGMRLSLTLTRVVVSVEDNPLESSVLRFKKFQRDYISHTDEYNEHLITSHLVSLADYNPLLMKIDLSNVSVTSQKPVYSTNDKNMIANRVVDFVRKTGGEGRLGTKMRPQEISRVDGIHVKLSVDSNHISIRDIPQPIIKNDKISMEIHMVNLKYKRLEAEDCIVKRSLSDGTSHFKVNLLVQGTQINAGLNLLSEINSVSKQIHRISESFITSFSKVQVPKSKSSGHRKPNVKGELEQKDGRSNPGATHNELKNKESSSRDLEDIRASFWDTNRFIYHGKLVVNFADFSVNVLTGTNPYQKDSIQLHVGSFHTTYMNESFKGLIDTFTIFRLTFQKQKEANLIERELVRNIVFRVPLVESLVNLNWHSSNDYLFFTNHDETDNIDGSSNLQKDLEDYISKDLQLDFKLHIPQSENSLKHPSSMVSMLQSDKKQSLEELLNASKVPILHYETNIINELINLPQLRHEYLLLHGIKPSTYKEQQDPSSESGKEDTSSNKQIAVYSNYIELITYTLNNKINRKDQNLLKFLSRVNFCLHTTSMRILLSNRDIVTPIITRLSTNNNKKERSGVKSGVREDNNKKGGGEVDEDNSVVESKGLQVIIESMSYSSTFYKKSLNIKSAAIEGEITEKVSGLKVWDMKDGNARIREILIGCLYTNLNLLNLENRNRKKWNNLQEDNMEDPSIFSRFFKTEMKHQSSKFRCEESSIKRNEKGGLGETPLRLALFEYEEMKNDIDDLCGMINEDSTPYLSPKLLSCISKKTRFEFNLETPKVEERKLEFHDDTFDNILDEDMNGSDLDQFQVFFSTSLILYEQSKSYQFDFLEGEQQVKIIREAIFQHFITLYGSKICFTSYIMKVIWNLLLVKNDRNLTKQKLERTNLKNSGLNEKQKDSNKINEKEEIKEPILDNLEVPAVGDRV